MKTREDLPMDFTGFKPKVKGVVLERGREREQKSIIIVELPYILHDYLV
jgi:hypothetical protein